MPVFLIDSLDRPAVGDRVRLDGAEGRHAVKVRRLRVGEQLVISDGIGPRRARPSGRGRSRLRLTIEVAELLSRRRRPVRWVAAQALAKGDRDELAIEMLTEVRDRRGRFRGRPPARSRAGAPTGSSAGSSRWRSTVREAAKQSRRLRRPGRRRAGGHEAVWSDRVAVRRARRSSCTRRRRNRSLRWTCPMRRRGPDHRRAGGWHRAGGAGGADLPADGRLVSLGDTVLRTSTAGVVALAALRLR